MSGDWYTHAELLAMNRMLGPSSTSRSGFRTNEEIIHEFKRELHRVGQEELRRRQKKPETPQQELVTPKKKKPKRRK